MQLLLAVMEFENYTNQSRNSLFRLCAIRVLEIIVVALLEASMHCRCQDHVAKITSGCLALPKYTWVGKEEKGGQSPLRLD